MWVQRPEIEQRFVDVEDTDRGHTFHASTITVSGILGETMIHSILRDIERKRDGHELSTDEIGLLVAGITAREVPDYQIGALLMAIYLRGMTDRETADLTIAMVRSGEVVNLDAIQGFKADKHSTGGVGDKVTPILGPLVAAAGVYFPKLSGRGLGHTGGTLDKLESIPGFRVDLSIEEFIEQVQAIGLAVTGQSAELVPADGILYALRDVTATVESIPLIASSVMSKKIAAGADGIVLDVKCGRGAFMQTQPEAVALARLMVTIGEAAGKRTAAVVTSMDEPLGNAVGNALEIAEAIEMLRGEGPTDLRDVCLLLGAQVLQMAGLCDGMEEGTSILAEKLASGAALDKLREMLQWQGGNAGVVDNLSLLPQAREVIPVPSPVNAYLRRIDALAVGLLASELGAGRQVKGAPVDYAVGVVLAAHVGDRVEKGQPLAFIHTNGRISDGEATRALLDACTFDAEPVSIMPHVLEVVAGMRPQGGR